MFSLKIQNFEPRKLAKNLAVNVEKRIQFTGRCTMKVSEREISRQMKVRKTAVPNTIKKISKNKYFQGQQKTGRLSIFSSGNKRFIRKRVSQLGETKKLIKDTKKNQANACSRNEPLSLYNTLCFVYVLFNFLLLLPLCVALIHCKLLLAFYYV